MNQNRIPAIDGFRGLLMIFMALDHAMLYWYQNPFRNEGLGKLWWNIPPLIDFLTRFISHPVAPGFIFICGLMMSLSAARHRALGHSETLITLNFLKRGILIILTGLFIMPQTIPLFGILTCIGSSFILLAVLRLVLSSINIFIISCLIILTSLCLPLSIIERSPSWLSVLFNIFFSIGYATKNLKILYPVFPWLGVMGLGFTAGPWVQKLYTSGRLIDLSKQLTISGICALLIFLPARIFIGIGDSPIQENHAFLSFFLMRKYPPSLTFLIWNLGIDLVLMGLFFRRQHYGNRNGIINRVLSTFGAVPFFFYIVHIHLYRLIPHATHSINHYSIFAAYSVWIAGLVIMYFLCTSYIKLRASRFDPGKNLNRLILGAVKALLKPANQKP